MAIIIFTQIFRYPKQNVDIDADRERIYAKYGGYITLSIVNMTGTVCLLYEYESILRHYF